MTPPSRLGLAYFSDRPGARAFYAFGTGEFGRAAEARAASRAAGRPEVGAALAAGNLAMGAGPATMAAIERLGSGSAFAVVTGQQAAPFTGPCYTILKAATAVDLCRRLRSGGLDCVPVFWAEGDDHDHAEIARTALGYGEAGLAELSFDWPRDLAGVPIGDLIPPMPRDELERRVRDLLPESGNREGAARFIFDRLPDGGKLGEWFGRLLLGLFADDGLVVAYPRHPGLRSLWRGLFPGILEDVGALSAEVAAASAAIRSAGFKPQIHKKADVCPFFLIEDGRRLPVRCAGGRFAAGGRSWSRGELEKRLADDPAAFSPGVILRPVIQDYLLPTVAYVGGLSEASYLGQLGGVYRRLGVAMPVVSPRLSATFVEPGVARALRKHALEPSRFLLEDAGRILARLPLPGGRGRKGAEAFWRKLEAGLSGPLAKYGAGLPPDLASMKGYLDKTAGRAIHLVREAEEKMNRALRARDRETRRRIEGASFRLRPEGGLMERKLNIFYFVARYGPDFVARLGASVPEDRLQHHFLELEDAP